MAILCTVPKNTPHLYERRQGATGRAKRTRCSLTHWAMFSNFQMAAHESTVTIEAGYRPGLLARCLEMHIAYYHPINSWGLAFESSVAAAWADLISRLNSNPRNQVFAAIQNSTPDDDPAAFTQKIVGTILVDAESMKQPDMAQIRGFIVDERVRGLGVGKRLLAAAMEFVEEMRFEKVSLYTARTQATSLFLYDRAGFVVVDDEEKDLWGWKMNELTLQWTRPGAPSPNDDLQEQGRESDGNMTKSLRTEGHTMPCERAEVRAG